MESLQGKKKNNNQPKNDKPAILGSEQMKTHTFVHLDETTEERKAKQSCILGLFAVGKQQDLWTAARSEVILWNLCLETCEKGSWKQLAWLPSPFWRQNTTAWPVTSTCLPWSYVLLHPRTHFFLSDTKRNIFLVWHAAGPLAKYISASTNNGFW